MGDSRSTQVGFALCGMALVAFGCAHGGPPAGSHPPSGPDVIPTLLSRAEAHLDRGLSLAETGDMVAARVEMDRAVDVFLDAPGGALSDARLVEAYQRTVDTIHSRELEAAAAQAGLVEGETEAAAIDVLSSLAVDETHASAETRRRTAQAVAEERIDLPVELNEPVLSCIGLYQGPLRDWFSAALARGGRYLPFIRAVLASEGLPQDLAYMALVESAFKPHALSRAKARGVWQFIPSTGRRFGLRQSWWIDERSDPEKSTRAAARYLKELHALFGDWNLAMAGYNAGENKVLRATRQHGTRDFWVLRRTRSLRRETKNYVPMIHAAIVVAKDPQRYGFDVVPETPLRYEHVPLKGPVDLRVVATCAGTDVSHLRELNPALRRLATPAREPFDVRVPLGSGTDVLACMGALPSEQRTAFTTHVVARGDTLSRIGRRYGVGAHDIAAANEMSIRSTLHVGRTLIVPVAARQRPPTAGPAAQGEDADRTAVKHVIRPGDTLGTIAHRYGTTVDALRRWNGLRGSRIAAGQELLVFPPAQQGRF